MSKVKNPKRRCRICGNKCEKQMRYCKLCARERKRGGGTTLKNQQEAKP